MIKVDAQIVAGKRLDVLAESVYRLLQQDVEAEIQIFIKNNTDSDIPISHPRVRVVPKDEPKTFEENHNQLAKLGKSPYILFLDDDSFLFPNAVSTLLKKIVSDEKIGLVGGVNNQTYPAKFRDTPVPSVGSLTEFKQNEQMYQRVHDSFAEGFKDQWVDRFQIPGNFLIVPRKIWWEEYGGWDENYKNWNEEIDYTFWCHDQGYKTLCTPQVWFYHCQAQSRKKQQLFNNIVDSSKHFDEKWPAFKLRILRDKIQRNFKDDSKDLIAEMNAFVGQNTQNMDPEKVRALGYFVVMSGLLER